MALDRSEEHVRELINGLRKDITEGVIVYGSSRITELIAQLEASRPDLRQLSSQAVCHYCGGRFPLSKITKDHIVPKSRGGANGMYNIVPACYPCNKAKGSKFPTCECEKCREAVRRYWQRPDITSSYK